MKPMRENKASTLQPIEPCGYMGIVAVIIKEEQKTKKDSPYLWHAARHPKIIKYYKITSSAIQIQASHTRSKREEISSSHPGDESADGALEEVGAGKRERRC